MIMKEFEIMKNQLVDSELESTRVFWRKKYFDATDEEAADPRPFIEVLGEREKNGGNHD